MSIPTLERLECESFSKSAKCGFTKTSIKIELSPHREKLEVVHQNDALAQYNRKDTT